MSEDERLSASIEALTNRATAAEIALSRERTLRIALTTRVGELQEELARMEGTRDSLQERVNELERDDALKDHEQADDEPDADEDGGQSGVDVHGLDDSKQED